MITKRRIKYLFTADMKKYVVRIWIGTAGECIILRSDIVTLTPE